MSTSAQRGSPRRSGRLSYQLKHRWRDGTTHVVFDPLDFISKLAALVPPPRFHLIRYHGVLAPCASERDHVVPAPPRRPPGNHGCCQAPLGAAASGSRTAEISVVAPVTDQRLASATTAAGPAVVVKIEHGHTLDHIIAGSAPSHSEPNPSRRRYSWPELMRRVFALEVLVCERCQAPTRIIADIHSPSAIRAILECLGLPARAPPVAAARAEGLDALSAEDNSSALCEHDGEATSGEE